VSRHGRGIRVSVLVSWPQWLRLGVGLLCGTVVMSGAQWRSRVTRGAVESSGQRWGSGLFLSFALPCLTARVGAGGGWGPTKG
jgi:hypothetical protein